MTNYLGTQWIQRGRWESDLRKIGDQHISNVRSRQSNSAKKKKKKKQQENTMAQLAGATHDDTSGEKESDGVNKSSVKMMPNGQWVCIWNRFRGLRKPRNLPPQQFLLWSKAVLCVAGITFTPNFSLSSILSGRHRVQIHHYCDHFLEFAKWGMVKAAGDEDSMLRFPPVLSVWCPSEFSHQ